MTVARAVRRRRWRALGALVPAFVPPLAAAGWLSAGAAFAAEVAPVASAARPPIVNHATVDLRLPGSSYGPSASLALEGGRLLVGAEAGTACRLVTLAATTLEILGEGAVSCDDPRRSGEPAMPVEAASRTTLTGTVRIARRDPTTGKVHLGPVVMTYPNISDGRPEWIYGGGFLWIYDVGSPATPGSAGAPGATAMPAEALRISLRTGAVLQRVAMPVLDRIVLAADQDGLWFGPSALSGWPLGHPPALLSFVGLGASRPRVLLAGSGSARAHVDWIVASGHTAFVGYETGRRGEPATTATYSSPSRPPRLVRSVVGTPAPSDIGEGSFDTAPVLDLAGAGLVTAEPGWLGTIGTGGSASETILVLDPSTGRARRFLRLATRPAGELEANVVAGGALYLLVGGTGRSVSIYRVAPV